jgi:helix-turn-helix protein
MESEVKQTHIKEITVVLQDEGLRKLKGFVQIPKAILLCQDISYGAKVAYSILLGYAWQDEFCFPAQESLANDLGCSVRQARRFLVELKERGFISWKQTGLNKPNVYYLLPLPEVKKNPSASKEAMKNMDRTNLSHPERTYLAAPEQTYLSHQEQTNMSAYKYSSNNNHNNVNVDKEGKGRGVTIEPKTDLHKLPTLEQDKAETELIANDILHQLGDRQSLPFYYLVASKVPESVIRHALAEIKQGGARYPARVFASCMKSYAAQQADTRSQSLHSAMQDMQKRMTLN